MLDAAQAPLHLPARCAHLALGPAQGSRLFGDRLAPCTAMLELLQVAANTPQHPGELLAIAGREVGTGGPSRLGAFFGELVLPVRQHLGQHPARRLPRTRLLCTLRDFPDVSRDADVVYCTPQKPHQLSLFTEVTELDVPSYDALYVTRPQIERFVRDGGRAPERYLRIEPQTLAGKKFQATALMHPLPRTGEIAYEMDKDPRSIYFLQAARGVHVRMALISVLLGRSSFKSPPPERAHDGEEVLGSPLACVNPTCISSKEAHLGSRFRVESRRPLRVRCAYCEIERPVGFVGDRGRRTAWRSGAPEALRVRAEEMVLFETDEQVRRAAFAN